MTKPKRPLSITMLHCLEFMRHHEGHIWRHPGGFWGQKVWALSVRYFSSATIDALVKRGLAEYDEWKDGRAMRFPVRATIVESKQPAGKT